MREMKFDFYSAVHFVPSFLPFTFFLNKKKLSSTFKTK